MITNHFGKKKVKKSGADILFLWGMKWTNKKFYTQNRDKKKCNIPVIFQKTSIDSAKIHISSLV